MQFYLVGRQAGLMLAVNLMSSDSWVSSLFTNYAGDDQNYDVCVGSITGLKVVLGLSQYV